jgi:hypothetical protein
MKGLNSFITRNYMYNIVFLVTGAYSVQNMNEILERERFIEYMLCLNKIFSYTKPVYGVCSEMIDINSENIPPFSRFPFRKLLLLDKSITENKSGKSMKEFLSIQALLSEMKGDPNLSDDTFVIKVSGRYLILKDTVYQLCDAYKENPNIQGIVRFAEDPGLLQQYTFLFAIRWKHLRVIYEQSPSLLGGKNIERFIVEYFEARNLLQNLYVVSELGILANINNSNEFKVY